MYTYICTKGHVDQAPTMGTYESCQVLQTLTKAGRVVGHVPCGCAVVRVPQDDGVETAFRMGGAKAVMDLISQRIKDGAVDFKSAVLSLSEQAA